MLEDFLDLLPRLLRLTACHAVDFGRFLGFKNSLWHTFSEDRFLSGQKCMEWRFPGKQWAFVTELKVFPSS